MSHIHSSPIPLLSQLLGGARDELARLDRDLARLSLRDLSVGMRKVHEEAAREKPARL